jgi:heat shock protein HslJ
MPPLIRLLRVLSALFASMMLIDGSSIARAELSELQGTYWRLDRIEGISDDHSKVILRIARAAIDFTAPCQFAVYPFGYDSSFLRIHPASARETFYPPPRKQGEALKCPTSPVMSAVDAVLPTIGKYAIDADRLTFLDGRDHGLMELSRILAQGLEDREWSIAEYWDVRKRSLVVAQYARAAFINGRVDGSPGCGALIGNYILSGTHLTVRATWVLGGACPKDDYAQNLFVVRALSDERVVEIDDNRAVLRDEHGVVQIVLKPQS